MDEYRNIRIFISSPGDVGQERFIAEKVVQKLQGEFSAYAKLDAILWEHEPLRATSHFQEQIVLPAETDIMVCILWSRLGTRLPGNFKRDDGSTFTSGTEWEFENALSGYRRKGTPVLMIFRKLNPPVVTLKDGDRVLEILEQKKSLDNFINKWFNGGNSVEASFNTFYNSEEFEQQLEKALREYIISKIVNFSYNEKSKVTWDKGSPYRGLESFDFEHSSIFFGRTKVIEDIKDSLIKQASINRAFLMVFGASGCGKSSLIKAGLIPFITEPGVIEGIGLWKWCTYKPSQCADDLVMGLTRAILSETAVYELAEQENPINELFKKEPEKIGIFIEAGLVKAALRIKNEEGLNKIPNARLLIYIDQMEEIFSIENISEKQRVYFVNALKELSKCGLIWIIGSMRSDFYGRCVEIPELMELKRGYGEYQLTYPTVSEIGQIIKYPAIAAGIRFQVDEKTHKGLDEVIIEEASKREEALPMLEFLLRELYNKKNEKDELTYAAYNGMGKLEGVIAHRAEEVISGLAPDVRKEFSYVFRWLITIDHKDESVVLRRRERYLRIANNRERKLLVDSMINARLLLADSGGQSGSEIAIVHEALLTKWPRLNQMVMEDRNFFYIRGIVSEKASIWIEEDKKADFLLPGGKLLNEGIFILSNRRNDLEPQIIDYILQSKKLFIKRQRKNRLTLAGATICFSVFMISFGIFSNAQGKIAKEKKETTMKSLEYLTYNVPNELMNIPGTIPVLNNIYSENVTLMDEIMEHDGNTDIALYNKAVNVAGQGDQWTILGEYRKAVDCYTRSIELLKKMSKDSQHKYFITESNQYNNIGRVYFMIGEYEKALKAHKSALKLLNDNVNKSDIRFERAFSYGEIARAENSLGSNQDYLKDLNNSIELYNSLLNDGEDRYVKMNLAYSYYNLAFYKMSESKTDTEEDWQKSLNLFLAIAEDLENTAISSDGWNQNRDMGSIKDICNCYSIMGDIKSKQLDFKASLNYYKKALDYSVILARDNNNIDLKRNAANLYKDISSIEILLNDKDKAKKTLELSKQLFTELAQNKDDRNAQYSMIDFYNKASIMYISLGQPEIGVSSSEKELLIAQELYKNKDDKIAKEALANAYGGLSCSELYNNQPKKAIEAAEKALEIEPGKLWILMNLAHGYLFDGEFEKAKEIYLKYKDEKIGDYIITKFEIPKETRNEIFSEAVLDNFQEFKSKGINNEGMDKIEKLYHQIN